MTALHLTQHNDMMIESQHVDYVKHLEAEWETVWKMIENQDIPCGHQMMKLSERVQILLSHVA